MTATDLQRREPAVGTVLNHAIAERFREAAGLLEAQRANPFRVSAYRRAADVHGHKGQIHHLRIDITVPGTEILVNCEPEANHAHEDVYLAIRDRFKVVPPAR